MNNQITAAYQDILERREILEVNFRKWQQRWEQMTAERNELLERVKAQSNSLQQYLNVADFDREVKLLKNYEDKSALIEEKRQKLQIELNTLLTEANNLTILLDKRTAAIAAVCINGMFPKTIQ